MYQEIQVFEIASWPFGLETAVPFVSMIMARFNESDYWEIEPWSANDFVLARWGFVRFIALRCMFIWCFVSTCKAPPPILVYKIPCKNYLREIFDDCSLPSHWGFSIKNPTIESEVSWSSLLSFLHFRRTEFTTALYVFFKWYWNNNNSSIVFSQIT